MGVCFLYCMDVFMYGFCIVWVCVCVGFVICVCMGFVMCGCVYVRVCVCLGFVLCGCVYVWVL